MQHREHPGTGGATPPLFLARVRSYIPEMDTIALRKVQVVERIRAAEAQQCDLDVQRLSHFGSCARKEAGPQRDVDLLVASEPGMKSFANFVALSLLLEELLECPVELVTREALRQSIGPHLFVEAQEVLRAT